MRFSMTVASGVFACALLALTPPASAARGAMDTLDAKGITNQVARALKGKDDAALRAAAARLVEALPAATSKAQTERLARLTPKLLRALLDAASSNEAKRLADAAAAARSKHGQYTDALAADLINAMGEADFEAGDAKKALAEFESSLQMREKAFGTHHPLVAESLNNIAVIQQSLGEFKLARGNFERSLKVREKTLPKNHKDIAESVNNLAVLHLATGHYSLAETKLKRGLSIRRINPGTDSLDYAASLNNLADLYGSIGDAERALPLQQLALTIRRKRLGDRHAQIAESRNNLGYLFAVHGDDNSAEQEYRQAIDIFVDLLGPKHATVARIKNNLGLLLLRAGKLDDAQSLLTESLELRRVLFGDLHPRTGHAVNNLARVYLARNDLPFASQLVAEALTIVEPGTDQDAKWRVFDTARKLEEARGNRPVAIVFAKRAVNVLQSLRIELRSLDKSLQQSFIKDKGDVYRALFELLAADGRLAEAQQVLVMLKEDEYFDFVQRSDKSDPRIAKVELSPTEAAAMQPYQKVSAEIVAMANERMRLRKKEKQDDADIARIALLDMDLRAAKRNFDSVLGEIHQHFARSSADRALEIGRMNLGELKAMQGTLEQLGEGTVTLHYVLLDDKVRMLLTTSRLQVARESTVNLSTLNRLIQSFRYALQHPSRDAQSGALQLHKLLIAPVAKDLEQAGAKTLMLSLDGALRYLPFGALHDGEQYLIEQFRLSMFAEAARDKLKDAPVLNWRAAGLGMTQHVEGFSALPSVAEELNAIVKTGHSGTGVIPGRIFLDNKFSRAAMLGALEEGYPVLHIASHFVFQPGVELESFLLLGDRSRLSLKEIKEDDYDFRKVELITLSACETAVGGGADSFGREIEGFAALVQKQGARSVMATLWEVADESTAQLMTLFYANRSLGHFSKAESLRQAQLMFLRGEVGKDESTSVTQRAAVTSALKIPAPVRSRRYSHPFYWAPFILTGNWL